jgi:hypothetical protein
VDLIFEYPLTHSGRVYQLIVAATGECDGAYVADSTWPGSWKTKVRSLSDSDAVTIKLKLVEACSSFYSV